MTFKQVLLSVRPNQCTAHFHRHAAKVNVLLEFQEQLLFRWRKCVHWCGAKQRSWSCSRHHFRILRWRQSNFSLLVSSFSKGGLLMRRRANHSPSAVTRLRSKIKQLGGHKAFVDNVLHCNAGSSGRNFIVFGWILRDYFLVFNAFCFGCSPLCNCCWKMTGFTTTNLHYEAEPKWPFCFCVIEKMLVLTEKGFYIAQNILCWWVAKLFM